MAGEWHLREVSDLIARGQLLVGDGYRAKNEELSTEGLPFARAGNIDGGFNFAGADRFPPENLGRVGNKVSEPGDVVFTSKGTVGRFAFVRPDTPRFVYSPQLCFWRSLDRAVVGPRFLYYWMQGREFFVQFKGVAGQTDMAEYVSLSDQRRMQITLPSGDEQEAIAHTLGTLDDKIELNRRMNETLEAMARALFQSWFVDFGPVRAKAEGRGPSLPKEIADLFPDRFDDSELGEIPAGWGVGPLEDIASVTMGLSPAGETYNVDGIGTPLINGPVEFGDHFPVKTKWTTSPTRLAQAGDLILCVRGSTTGRRVVADDSYCLGRGVCAIRARRHTRTFLYQTVNTAIDRLLSKTTGSVFPNLSAPDIKELPVLDPAPQLGEMFDSIAEPLTERAEANVRQSGTLAALRNTLLPKLISGELRVRDAQRFVGGVDTMNEVDSGGA